VERGERKGRLVFLYTDAAQAVSLLQRIPSADYDLISCPLSAQTDRWLDEFDPDLILLDPPPEQKEFLKTCESLRAQTDRPIVVMSERSDELAIARVLAAGIDEYLVQPIGERELTARIGAMLRRIRRYGEPGGSNQTGGLVLSSSDLSAELDGRRVFLSPIEFRLLTSLASAPGKVLTHQTLMARVWGAEYVDSRHYLRLYIRYLREKLEEDPSQPQMILSEWGVGYRFQPPEPARR
jgi:two-component system KDP operon response regulator KdpE